MKKIVMILVAVIGFGISAFADNYYQVTVGTLKTLHYFDDNDTEIGSTSVAGMSQVIMVCAKTEYEAQEKAIAECATMCKRSYYKLEPIRLSTFRYPISCLAHCLERNVSPIRRTASSRLSR
jgi:uncharacterized membrane protein